MVHKKSAIEISTQPLEQRRRGQRQNHINFKSSIIQSNLNISQPSKHRRENFRMEKSTAGNSTLVASKTKGKTSNDFILNAIIDPASELSLIPEKIVKKLKLITAKRQFNLNVPKRLVQKHVTTKLIVLSNIYNYTVEAIVITKQQNLPQLILGKKDYTNMVNSGLIPRIAKNEELKSSLSCIAKLTQST